MKNSPRIWPALPALILSLARWLRCGRHIAKLAAIKRCAMPRPGRAQEQRPSLPPERSRSELAALRKAGYDPSPWFDPHYPEDAQAAQRQVDRWYQAECQQAEPD
ncbi:hypothetical protein HDG32_007416 [Paraburkholderia sp. CI2]|nr:hypothetical protein [Paraburkholderia sp. CI2]